MGDFLQSILGGPSAPGPITVPPMTGDPAAMNPGMKMFGITPEMLAGPQGITGRGGISEAGAIPGGGQQDAVDAIVTGFKPKKLNFFQALGDQLLMHWGNKPIFEKRNHDKNMKRAMEGFTSDPKEAISRISQFDPDLAWQLLNTVQDNQRQNAVLERQNRALDMRNDDYLYQQTAGMMGAATPETWGQMRDLALKRAAARNGNVEALAGIIPEQYDPSAIEYIRYGAIKPKDQMVIAERKANNEARVALGRDRLGETSRHNAVQEGQGAEKIDLSKQKEKRIASQPPSGKGQPKVIMTPAGNQLIIHPSGLGAVMTKVDGTKVELEKFGNGWRIRKPKAK